MATTLDEQIALDYEQARTSCGLVDRSDRGKLALTGPGSAEFLNGQVTNDIAALRPGEGCYAAFLTHKGKMLGDVRVLAVADVSAGATTRDTADVSAGATTRDTADASASATTPGGAATPVQLLLDTERSALQAVFDTLRIHRVGFATELHKRTLQCGLLSLVGPRCDDVVREAAADHELPAEREHANRPAHVAGGDVLLVRTDLGIDVLCAADDTDAVCAAVIEHGATPIAPDAAEVVRVESGRPRYGLDLDDSVIPQEAALNERAVSFTKGCYVGQETVARLFYRGKPNRHLRGLLLSGEVAVGDELRLGDRAVGSLSSSVISPRLGAIGLALVRREAEPGAELSVGARGGRAVVVTLPFADGRAATA